ncbi:hypothetical protein PPMP20_26675 [Paraburkholderia phymatum]|uniref:Uncharacterized protein n=1 Tax=Paraburkholderia phymatum (strain DSM 17167 / CIP 108236 / LMG 21445 / STM815) TaxID=391038 RepID=B2JL26_PARP8|nr:hypothetical protein [Paraburkholderia phymatum]ACC72555.1 hypothetical protein Bphy_3401 [Paraburkholderia phymatum STM815]
MIPSIWRRRAAAAGFAIVSTSSAYGTAPVVNQGNAYANVPAPTNISAGNFLYAFYVADELTITPTLACSGWTTHRTYQYSGNNNYGFIGALYKVATASEPASYSFGGTGVNTFSLCILNMTGVVTSDPFSGVTPTNAKANSATTTFATVTRPRAGAQLLVAVTGSSYSPNVANAWTPPASYTLAGQITDLYNQPGKGEAQAAFSAVRTNAPAGATGSMTGTLGKSYYNGTMNVVLNTG